MQNRLSVTRRAVTSVRYRNRAKISEPAISMKIKGKKYGPEGNSRQPSVSDTAAAAIATTGPNTMAPKALMKNATLMRRLAAMGILMDLSATRSAIISAAKISMSSRLNSDAA